MSKSSQKPLFLTFTYPILIIGIISFVLFALIATFLINQTIRNNIQSRTQITGDIFGRSIRDDIIHGLDKEVHRKCVALFKDNDVQYVHVKNAEPRVVCEFGDLFEKPLLIEKSLFFDEEQQQSAGEIQIGFRYNLGYAVLYRFLIALFFALILLAILYTLTVRFWLRKKTQAFTALARKIERGKIEDLMNIEDSFTNQDSFEFLKLKESVQRMARNWKAYQDELIRTENLRAVNRSSRVLAHDIKSPLSALKTALQTLQTKPEASLKLLKRGIERIEDLSKEIVVSDEFVSPTKASNAEITALHGYFKQLLQEIEEMYASFSDVHFETTIDPLLKEIESPIHPQLLSRAIHNIIKNAVEAKGDEHLILTVNIHRDGKQFSIVISDNGKGMEPELLKRIGQEGVTQGKKEGSGLGLLQVHEMVERHQGDLKIESVLCKGTTLIIKLPLEAKPRLE